MNNTTKATVPTYQEIAGKKLLLTDYAVATGALRRDVIYERGHKCLQYGECWVREPGTRPGYVSVANQTVKGTLNRRPECNGIAVAPRFQNPKAKGLAIARLNGKSVLTINGKVPCYPSKEVDEITAAELSSCLDRYDFIHDKNTKLDNFPDDIADALLDDEYIFDEVGAYTSDAQPVSVFNNKPYQPQVNKCYAYNGKNYVFVSNVKTPNANGVGHWYECEAVPAKECRDGSIQCKHEMFASRFAMTENEISKIAGTSGVGYEFNTDEFFIGEQVNLFLHELELSTEFTHLQVSEKFSKVNKFPTALKNRVKSLFNQNKVDAGLER